MKLSNLALLLSVLLMALPVLANPERPAGANEVAGATKARTAGTATLTQSDSPAESVTPELANIVVLCATEQEEKFEREWRRYVDKHELQGVELAETIAWVSEEAASRRHKDHPEKGDKEKKDWADKRRAFMNEVANRALVPAR